MAGDYGWRLGLRSFLRRYVYSRTLPSTSCVAQLPRCIPTSKAQSVLSSLNSVRSISLTGRKSWGSKVVLIYIHSAPSTSFSTVVRDGCHLSIDKCKYGEDASGPLARGEDRTAPEDYNRNAFSRDITFPFRNLGGFLREQGVTATGRAFMKVLRRASLT